MAQQVTLKAVGLNYSPNSLALPEGSMVIANDVVIRRDNTVEPRRGNKEYSEGLGSSSDRSKQLLEYKNRVLVNYANKLAYDTGVLDTNGKAIFANFAGTYTEAQVGLRMKYIEANKNLYFTSGDGIKKISAKTAADFTTASGFIKPAGAVKALDFTAKLSVTQGQLAGILPPDTAVAYRVLWGYKDRNDNLLEGFPSDRAVVYNYLSDLLAMDIDTLCIRLDALNQGASLITDGNYAASFYTPVNPDSATLLSDVLQLAIKLDNDIYLGNTTGTGAPLVMATADITNNIATINFTTGNPSNYLSINDRIEISNMVAPFTVFNGTHQLDFSPTSTKITFTLTNTNIGSAATTAGDIYSDNYRNITTTGDDTFTTPLDQLTLSTPATSDQLRTINNTLFRIVERLKVEKPAVIPTAQQNDYISTFQLTERADVQLNITIPSNIDDQYFVQVYRTLNFTASGVQTLGGTGGIPVIPDDEMRLVYEAFPTTAEIAAGTLLFLDTYPEELVQNNTNLYTNPTTGEGILQANEPPPFAKDINTFKNVTFYANTRTRHKIVNFQLLGLSNISNGDTLTITDVSGTQTYKFVDGVNEQTNVTCTAGSTITGGMYFIFHNALDAQKYYFWYEVSGAGSAPVVTDGITVKIPILTGFTANQVADRTRDVVNSFVYDFFAEENTLPTIRVTAIAEGKCTDATAGTTPFTVAVTQQGDGEDAATKQVLKSSLVSAAQAIDETARSLIRVINKQSDSIVNAYYISSDTTPPGQINLELKVLDETPFYILGSSTGIGSSFNPNVAPDNTNITAISAANPTVITTSSPHGLNNLDQIVIAGSNSTPSVNGIQTVTVLSSTTFSIPVHVTIAGTIGVWSTVADTTVSTNEVKPNRVFYSKLSQPEAVPLLNYFDVSAEDQDILRIFPLRSSLFVFKQDGTYRVSGQVAPFNTALLDTSCVVVAPDSVDVCNNTIYAWTSKGITPVTENGAGSEVSRPIDTAILKLSSSTYTNFKTLTWGVGYDSDNSYTVYTNSATDDTSATIGFRYCTLTNTWTNFIRNQTCGVVAKDIDKLYMGAGDSNLIHEERKSFTRTDFADKDFIVSLDQASLFLSGKQLDFTSVTGMNIGDVITQEQTLTIYTFNKLLTQLDLDPTVGDKNYYSTLMAIPGDSLRTKLVALATKMDSDSGLAFSDYSTRIASKSGTISSNAVGANSIVTTSSAHGLVNGRVITISGTQTPSSVPALSGNYIVNNTGTFGVSTTYAIPVTATTAGGTGLSFTTASNLNTFEDIQACYNEIVNHLNADTGATYNNYKLVTDTTIFEAVILAVDKKLNKIMVNLPLQWVVGPMTVFNAINCQIVYAPVTMGDPLNTKQISEATFMFENKAWTKMTASFSSDLKPEFTAIDFYGQGNGIFGSYSDPGFGYGFFGGGSNSAPIRTLVPKDAQRCRFLNVQLTHRVARENWALLGTTLTGNVGISSRGYR